jgi:hypothetical protein
MYLARQAYFPVWGTCWESVAGGHHFRAWRQNGTHGDSGAWFIGYVHPSTITPQLHPTPGTPPSSHIYYLFIDACMQTKMYRASKEEPSQKRHKISKNGYNLGRDWFVERALAGSHWKGRQIWWRAEVEWRTDLIESGNKGASASSPVYFLCRSDGTLTHRACRRKPRHPAGRACRHPHRLPRLDIDHFGFISQFTTDSN